MDAKIVILGGTGFIGSALVEHLKGASPVPVTGYGSASFDLTNSQCVEKLSEMLDRHTTVVLTARARQQSDPMAAFTGDIVIATNVARCLSRQPVKKCVYFSTTSVYGDGATDLIITEETKIAPTSLYGAAKFAGECVLRQATENAGIPTVILRPCMVYGPGDTSRAYGPARFISAILRDRQVRVFGDGSELRDYLFIGDLVRITAHLLLGDSCGTFNLATGQSHTFQEMLACLRGITHDPFEVVQWDRDRPRTDQRLDPARLLSLMPGFRFTEFDRGLRATYMYFSRTLPH